MSLSLSFRFAAVAVPCALTLVTVTTDANAWIFSEHTRATHASFTRLSKTAGDRIRQDWAALSKADAQLHLCSDVATEVPEGRMGEDEAHWCSSFASLPALAGDHSCSPGRLMRSMREATWIRDVLELSIDSAEKLAKAESSIPRRLDARRGQHLRLQILDAKYATRAENNNSHFQLPRSPTPVGRDALTEYLKTVTENGQLANATASFLYYHAAALELARYAGTLRRMSSPDFTTYAKWAFFNESFALHFLEDSFAAGHFVGTWGDTAQRLGTHDYYCQQGVDALTWSGERYAARGDAFMSDPERDRVADAIAVSLEQFGGALEGVPLAAGDPLGVAHQLNYDFEVCNAPYVPAATDLFASSAAGQAVLKSEPIPPSESPALPRFRTELGVNVGPSLSIDGALIQPVTTDGALGGAGRARFGIRLGLGVTDLLTRSEDGNSFIEGIVLGERSKDGSQSGFGFRVHTPFAYIPFDGIPISFCALGLKWPGCISGSRRAASGSIYRINPTARIGQYASVGVSVLRDVAVLFLNEGRDGSPTRRDLLANVLTMRTGTDYSGRLATHIGIDLGFQWRHQYGITEEHFLGGYLSLFTDTPYYFWP